jgi:hypothetical protein
MSENPASTIPSSSLSSSFAPTELRDFEQGSLGHPFRKGKGGRGREGEGGERGRAGERGKEREQETNALV